METYGDKLRALALALGVHALCILAVLIGMWWTVQTRPVTMPGPVIEVDLVGPTAAPKPRSVAVRQPSRPKVAPPKPAPETIKPEIARPEPPKIAKEPDAPPPSEVERQDQVERERIAALAAEKAEQEKREQEEKRRQEQVLLEEKQKKLEEERRKQLADVRRQREAAEKALKLEKQKLAQLEDQRRREQEEAEEEPSAEHPAERAQTGAGGRDDDLSARYAAAIQSAVTNNWNRPDSATAGLRCSIDIVQIPGGDVISATVVAPCNADPVTRRSIEQAVEKASPLPYQGYEKVFQRSVRFNFKYDG